MLDRLETPETDTLDTLDSASFSRAGDRARIETELSRWIERPLHDVNE